MLGPFHLDSNCFVYTNLPVHRGNPNQGRCDAFTVFCGLLLIVLSLKSVYERASGNASGEILGQVMKKRERALGDHHRAFAAGWSGGHALLSKSMTTLGRYYYSWAAA